MRFMISKKMTWRGLVMAALALGGLTACDDSNKPAPQEEPKDKEPSMTILIEYIDEETGETTRAVSGDADYHFSDYGKGGEVQMEGAGFYKATAAEPAVKPDLYFHAKEKVVFKGWSWRYHEDPKGTHRDNSGSVVSDFVKTPVFQQKSGLQKLPESTKPKFTCYYDDAKVNKVYVKVNYVRIREPYKELPGVHLTIFPEQGFVQAGGRSLPLGYDYHPILKQAEKQGAIGQQLASLMSFTRRNLGQYRFDLEQQGVYYAETTLLALEELGNALSRDALMLGESLVRVNRDYMYNYDHSATLKNRYTEKLEATLKEKAKLINEKMDALYTQDAYHLLMSLAGIGNSGASIISQYAALYEYYADEISRNLRSGPEGYHGWFYLMP